MIQDKPQKVCLVNMPFTSIKRPSVSLGILSAILRNRGIEVDVRYPNLPFAELIGIDLYNTLCGESSYEANFSSNTLIGEWIFSQNYYGLNKIQHQEYFSDVLMKGIVSVDNKYIRKIEEILPRIELYLESLLNTIDWSQYTIIGFTSTFEQTFASLCLAKKIKAKFPNVLTGIGGSNCEGVMGKEMFSTFSFLDFVSTGEADNSFIQLIEKYFNNDESWKQVDGFIIRHNKEIYRNKISETQIKLDHLPIPDYTEYFQEIESFQSLNKQSIVLPLETSRGCKWGEKRHCSFCGQNGTRMKFRIKSFEKIKSELDHFLSKYNTNNILYIDNYFDTKENLEYLKHLEKLSSDIKISITTRSSLRRSLVKQLSLSKVISVDPGIESFSNSILKKMNKGIHSFSNIALLKWGHHYGIDINYNILVGIPGETVEDYKTHCRIFKTLTHLAPPICFTPILLHRFSPYFDNPETFGIKEIKPKPQYYYVFREKESTVNSIAYMFDYSSKILVDTKYFKELFSFWEDWYNKENKGELVIQKESDSYHIMDTRYNWKKSKYSLTRIELAILAYFDSPGNINSTDKIFHFTYDNVEIKEFIKMMVNLGFMLVEDDMVISLPIIPDEILDDIIFPYTDSTKSRSLL